jgi:uncharacterized protein (DUF486 family)
MLNKILDIIILILMVTVFITVHNKTNEIKELKKEINHLKTIKQVDTFEVNKTFTFKYLKESIDSCYQDIPSTDGNHTINLKDFK